MISACRAKNSGFSASNIFLAYHRLPDRSRQKAEGFSQKAANIRAGEDLSGKMLDPLCKHR
jgi:hypothetical protein